MIKLKKDFLKALTVAVVTVSLVFTSLPVYNANAADTDSTLSTQEVYESKDSNYGLTDNIKDGTILHAWCWSFDTIKDNMKDIAESGFSTVQTSPANACLVGENGGMQIYGNGKWYYHYQPTDWKIGNYQLGTRDEFKEMCDEAHKYGVKVIVDVVPNHTTPTLDAVSNDLKNAVGGQDNLYHANGFNGINDYNNRYECTTGEMGGLPDVNTENPNFQKYFVNYLNDCITCGADGFRYDTAKHIGLPSDPKDNKSSNNNFWKVVTGKESVDGVSLRDSNRIFNYGEVLQDRQKSVKEEEYSNYVSQTASNYGYDLRDAVRKNNFNVNTILNYDHPVKPNKLITWAESHDTYCNEDSYQLNNDQIKMIYAAITARKEGTPLFYSRPDGSSPSNKWGNNEIGKRGDDTFKDTEVVEVNKFRNAMVGESEYLRNINGNNQILSIERGDKGQVIINLGNDCDINSDTNLADGDYKDKVSGNIFNVSNGKISGHLNGYKIAVLYGNNESSISASKESCSYTGNSMNVTLKCSNVTDAKYSIDGNEKKSYKDGTEITIGEDKEAGEDTVLKLSAKDSKGKTISEEYTYTKEEVKEGIYFVKPSDWGNNIKVYIYDEKSGSSVQEISKWPGTSMKSLGGNRYYFEIPSSWTCEDTRVIFTDGSNQVPKSTGFSYTLGKAMEYKNDNWTELEISNPTEKSNISASVEDCKYKDTLEVTLNSKNVTNAKYSIDGNEKKSFKDGTTITIGKDKEDGDETVLKLTAKDSNGKTISEEYTYTKETIPVYKEGLYFKKPSGWGNNIKVYLYDEKSESSVKENAKWPGTAMESLGDDMYYYEIPSDWNYSNTRVIFTDGSNQVPKSTGLSYTLGTAMKYEDGNWEKLSTK